MRSTSWSELAGYALGAVVEGVWIGAAAALITTQSGPAFMAFSAAVVFAAALLARRAGGAGAPGGAGRAAVVALALVAAGTIFAATRSWAGPHVAVTAVGAVVFGAILVLPGVLLGREPVSPYSAIRLAVRGFLLLCAVLALAAVGHSTPAWAGAAVVVGLVAGGLLVAVARYQVLVTTVPASERAPASRWLLAVLGALLLVAAVGVLLGLVLRVDVLLWALGVAGELLRYLLRLVGYVFGWAGAGVLRALSWVLGLFHVHALPTPKSPEAIHADLHPLRGRPQRGTWSVARTILTIVAAVVAVVVPLALVALALRRTRRRDQSEVDEEREAVTTLREAAGDAAARLGRRLRRLVPRRAPPATPAQRIRRRYQELERRLTRAGHPRPPGTTVRTYLTSLPGAAAAVAPAESGAWTAAGVSGAAAGARAATPAAGATAAAGALAAGYELARYSAHTVDEEQARRFEADAAVLAATASAPSRAASAPAPAASSG